MIRITIVLAIFAISALAQKPTLGNWVNAPDAAFSLSFDGELVTGRGAFAYTSYYLLNQVAHQFYANVTWYVPGEKVDGELFLFLGTEINFGNNTLISATAALLAKDSDCTHGSLPRARSCGKWKEYDGANNFIRSISCVLVNGDRVTVSIDYRKDNTPLHSFNALTISYASLAAKSNTIVVNPLTTVDVAPMSIQLPSQCKNDNVAAFTKLFN